MGTWFDRRYTAEHWDHERDLRKHEPRPSDKLPPLPLYAQSPQVSGALEVAILAQAVPLRNAAELIEQYAQTSIAAAGLDETIAKLDRTIAGDPQNIAIAKLIGYCRGICGSGVLGEKSETELRQRVAEAMAAFKMEEPA